MIFNANLNPPILSHSEFVLFFWLPCLLLFVSSLAHLEAVEEKHKATNSEDWHFQEGGGHSKNLCTKSTQVLKATNFCLQVTEKIYCFHISFSPAAHPGFHG